jgi:hypothetical protein
MKNKDEIARDLAEYHRNSEPTIERIVRYVSDQEDLSEEPIKLLEVNPATVSMGILPVWFGPSQDIPYPLVVIEITSEEFSRLGKDLALPENWKDEQVLFSSS